MLATVLRHEHNLFTLEEIDCLSRYNTMSCASLNTLITSSHRLVGIDHARYLLVRLCLRKTDKWHRLSALKYEGELGDNIRQAIAELCGKIGPPASDKPAPPANVATSGEPSGSSVKTEPLHLTQDLLPFAEVKVEPQETIISDAPGPTPKANGPEIPDLTMDAEDAEQPRPAPQAAAPAAQENTAVFAEDESGASLRDLLECLTVEELKGVAKQFKVKGSAKACKIRHSCNHCLPANSQVCRMC